MTPLINKINANHSMGTFMKKEIRALGINDINFIYDELQLSYTTQHVIHRFNYSKEEFSNLLFGETSIAEGLILLINDEPSGFLLYTIDHRNFTLNLLPNLYLNDLYVKKTKQRLGGATLLLNALQKIARERKYGQIEWLVQKDNQEAVKFYENFNVTYLSDDLEYLRLKLS